MKNLFQPDVHQFILQRIERLTPDSTPKWGKMNVTQMLKHCSKVFGIPLSEKPIPRVFIGYIIGPLFKKQLYNDKPWKKNLATTPFLKTTEDDLSFNHERQTLIDCIHQFCNKDPKQISVHPHPVFGKFDETQWGQAMYKHLDHHLTQFGV
jgi:hypothetical protein